MPEPSLWVRVDVLPTGAYAVSINVGDDRAWTLSPDRAIAYAATCVRRATEVEHDAAAVALLLDTGLPARHAVGLVAEDLRPHRAVDHGPTLPLRFEPVLGVKHGPHLRMLLDDVEVGSVFPSELVDHAIGVLRCVAAADLDAALQRTLASSYGLGQERATGVVASLAEHWPAPRTREASR